MKNLLLAFVLLCGCEAVRAQHYLVAGAGFGVMQFNSEDLDRFQQTYNDLNVQFGQNLLLKGFDLGVGLSSEISYRHHGTKRAMAFTVGFQEEKATDVSGFANGTSRDLRLRVRNFYVQPALGYAQEFFFIEGFTTFFFSRKFQIDSRQVGTEESNPLNGVYNSTVRGAADLGVAFGMISGPIMLVLKVSHPIRKSGGSKILTDPSPEKVADNYNAFPDDVFNFYTGVPYRGVASDIDGFKVSVTLNYALRLSPERER